MNIAMIWRDWDRKHLVVAGSAVGLLVFTGLLGLAFDSIGKRFWHAYLIQVSFLLTIGLGSLFFVVLHHLVNAKWSVVVRRIAEYMTLLIPLAGILMLPILVPLLIGYGGLYHWNDAKYIADDVLIQGKTGYLNGPFFVARAVLYFAAWCGLAFFYLNGSLKQDQAEDLVAWHRMRRFSGPSMILFALTVNFAAFDWIMTLDAHWFSSIFGVYYFAASAVAFLATLTLGVLGLQRAGHLEKEITAEHYHDLGKLLFGFNMFWAYIAFSQYLLIWYANIPEETVWFLRRQEGGWQWIGLLLVFGHFLLPLFGLMSRQQRRNPRNLAFWAAFLLVMHWFDLYWLIMPEATSSPVVFAVAELFTLAGCLAIAGVWLLRNVRGKRLIPSGDPYLNQSLSFHNV